MCWHGDEVDEDSSEVKFCWLDLLFTRTLTVILCGLMSSVLLFPRLCLQSFHNSYCREL